MSVLFKVQVYENPCQLEPNRQRMYTNEELYKMWEKGYEIIFDNDKSKDLFFDMYYSDKLEKENIKELCCEEEIEYNNWTL